MSNDPSRLTVEDNGYVLAEATVRFDADQQSLQANLHVESGHLPIGTRTQLVDAVLDQNVATPGSHLRVTLPAGDTEILDRLRQRCDGVQTRLAGASCLATGTIGPRRTDPR